MDRLFFNSKATEAMVNFLFPPFCLGCESYLGWRADPRKLCGPCERKLKIDCQDTTHVVLGGRFLEKIFVFGRYGEDPLTKLIHKTKYENKSWALEPILSDLEDFLKTQGLDLIADLVTCVPLHRRRLRERGFNQAELIAEYVARVLGKPFYKDLLRRVRFTKPQMSIPEKDRRLANVKGVFQLDRERDFKDKKVLLVDDVATTMATLENAAQALKALDCKVFGFVLAH